MSKNLLEEGVDSKKHKPQQTLSLASRPGISPLACHWTDPEGGFLSLLSNDKTVGVWQLCTW